MIDPFLSQSWAERHHTFTGWLGRLADQILYAFERLAARNYDAPWLECKEQKPRKLPFLSWR